MASGNYEIRIEKLVYGGEGLGRRHGKVVFVPFSVPGDRLLVRSRETKKNYSRAEILRVIGPASDRRPPLCPYFGRCGGCQWQHIQYRGQVEAKRRILEEALCHRFAETRDLLIGIRASPAEYGYRSRARLQAGASPGGHNLGFFALRSHAVVDIESCPLFRPALNAALRAVREHRRTAGLSAPGALDIACSQESRQWVWTTEALSGNPERAPHRAGPGAPDENFLVRVVRGYRYTISAGAFFQANDFMLPDLLDTVLELAQASGARSAIELYSGVGFFTLPLASIMEQVVAIEGSPVAAELCSLNALRNGLTNIRVIQADALAWMRSEGPKSIAAPALVILNPPRAGAGTEIMRHLPSWDPAAIIYVSCDPQTLVRDLSVLRQCDYRLDSVEGLDLFPQTYHFETVVRLSRK